MNFKKIASSSKSYKVTLIIASVFLLFFALLTYKQIQNLSKAADMVAHSLLVDNQINRLVFQYNLMEVAELRSVILNDSLYLDSYKNYVRKSEEILAKLYELIPDDPGQQKYLDSITKSKNQLLAKLAVLETKIASSGEQAQITEDLKEVAEIVNGLTDFKTNVILNRENQRRERLSTYNSQIVFTPLTSLLLVLFSIAILFFSFVKIKRDRDRIVSSEEFLQSILRTTDNIVNYYEPIYDASGKIVDFRIVFANECNRNYLGLAPEDMIGKRLSVIFPFTFLNGDFKKMSNCFVTKEKLILNRQIFFNQQKMWFYSIVKPVSNGLLVVARNSTKEKEDEDALLTLNDELKTQNTNLGETRQFLQTILDSTDSIVSHYEAIRDGQNEIIDFKILYLAENSKHFKNNTTKKVVGELLSVVDPLLFHSDMYSLFMECVQSQKKVITERVLHLQGKELIFRNTLQPIGERITLTEIDITQEKLAEKNLTLLNEKLQIQNSILINAKKMAHLGSFTWDIETNHFEISDNFYQLLGCDPTDFITNHDHYRSYIHPDDKSMYDAFAKEAVVQKSPKDIIYRIISKDGLVKYLDTTGHFMEKEGKAFMIGVVQDVTQRIHNEQKLINRNIELKRSNTELEYFNRIASHDLQEPLRHVQLFISRIFENEKEKITGKNKEYFVKINNATKQMQSLIQNLLAYSEIQSSHENFVEVDLNLTLEKVKENFQESIKESGIKLVIQPMPVILGVPFQMEQLFTNLISNSIKFRNPKTTPKILIDAAIVSQEQVNVDLIKTSRNYHKITVVDNGIGFDQKSAEKIFQIFQRLNSKADYPGTGIGLSICKKIVENHHGAITTTSDQKKGSIFYIYLPVTQA